MKKLLLFSLISLCLSAQTTVNMPSLIVSAEAAAAVQKWMLGQVKTQLALAQPVASTDLTITLADASKVKANDTLVIETEAVGVSSVSGNIVTVTRANLGTVAAAHPQNSSVGNLQYQSIKALFKSVIGQAVSQIMDAVGSDTINTQNQVITTANAAKQAAKDAAVQ